MKLCSRTIKILCQSFKPQTVPHSCWKLYNSPQHSCSQNICCKPNILQVLIVWPFDKSKRLNYWIFAIAFMFIYIILLLCKSLQHWCELLYIKYRRSKKKVKLIIFCMQMNIFHLNVFAFIYLIRGHKNSYVPQRFISTLYL